MTGKTVLQGVAVAALVLAAGAPRAAAQAKLELTPFFTSYYAVSPILEFAIPDIVGTEDFTIEAKQIPGPGLGGRLTYWMPSGLGFEAAVSYAFSGVRVLIQDPTDTLQFTSDESLKGNVLSATGRVLYRLPRSNFHLFGGAGTVKRGGEVWEGSPSLSDITGVAGFGARAAVTPKLSLDVKVEAYFYSFDTFREAATNPTTGESLFDAKFQTDIHVSIGVPIALMK